MKKSSILSLVLITLFVFSLVDLSGSGIPTTNSGLLESPAVQNQVSEVGGPYVGTGSPLTVSFSGTFANASPWIESSNTLSNVLTPGVSYSVDNSSSVTWTANVLVSPPINVSTFGFSVTYPVTDWKPVSLSDPLGVLRSNPSEWYYAYDTIYVLESTIDTHGIWTFEFIAANHLDDLEMGISGGLYASTTTTFDTGDTMRFGVTSSWISGASAEFDLIDPLGSIWYSTTNTTSGPTTHVLSSFRYHKDITIHNAYVTGDFTDFPVLIDILDQDLHDDVQSDGDDILFYSNGTILAHEIELFEQDYNPTQGHLVAWVKANLTNSADTIITMYYGNPEVGPQTQPEEVWTSDYLGVWHLGESATDEGTSTDHLDSTGNEYFGDQSGNENITGIFGDGQNFDGTDDTVNISGTRALEPSGDVTMSGWFKLDSAINQISGTTEVLLTKAIDGDTDMHIAIAGSDYTRTDIPQGSLVFKMENAGLGQLYVWSLRQTWSSGTWYYFTCTMTASTPSLNKVFVNGVDDTNTTTGSLATASLSFTDDWEIGGGFIDQLSPKIGWFDGVIDEVRVVDTIRSNAWIQTEWLMYQSSSQFRTLDTESVQTSPDMYIEKTLDLTAQAGLWTISTHYNDSGSSVSHRVGEYQRNFIVRRDSTLDIDSPADAAAGLETLMVGDMLYLVVDLSDANNADPSIGATVSMNWTTPSTVYFEDFGDGRYSVARNTSELGDMKRWLIEINATHPFYSDASKSFNLDLYHPTQLTYEWVSTTPVGFDVDATLVYRDTWDGSLISGATITLGDGTPVVATPWSAGRYNVTIDADSLSPGVYSEIYNATKPSDLYEMASSTVTYAMRAHYTAVSVSGNLETPYGDDTTINVVLVDLDTGLTLDATVVDSLSFVSSEGTQNEPSVSNLNGLTLDTNTWAVNTYSVNVSVVMSDSDFYAPALYTFDVEIRNHLTAATVIGDLTTAYGANTSITVSLTDLDSGIIDIGSVTSFTFTSSQPIQVYNSPSSFSFSLDTDDWTVSTIVVTLTIDLSGNYDDPIAYVFSITIHSLQTTLYNAPSNLVFTQGSNFTIDLHFNVSETGTYYGNPINGESGQFVITPYPTTVTPLGDGMYRLTIAWSNFDGQGTDFTINVDVTPSSSLYAAANTVISFQYRAIISDLTANLYTVSTPYLMDVTVHLYYTDRDSSTGITTATITGNSTINSQFHISDGDYQVELDVSSFGIGSHDVNLTASAAGYNTKWLIITIVVTQIHTDAEPTTIRLEIPSGNSEIFYIEWTDLDNGVSLEGVSEDHNWTGNVAPTFTYLTGEGRYQMTFTTDSLDTLGTYLVWFSFSIDGNYQDGYCEIQVEIRSHDTILTSDSPPPTAFNSLINITMYYYDFDNKIGIHDLVNVQEYVYESASPIASSLLVVGSGYYTVQIDASTVGLGLHNFTVFINWTGVIQQYENKSVFVSVNVVGVDSQMTLITAADPSPYSEVMTYTFLFSEKDSGIGITNTTDQGYGTGHVHILVSFDAPFNPLQLTISEVGSGIYQIDIDTTGFGQIGQFSMSITIQWDPVSPFYSPRLDSVSVWVLARDTILLINPPSPESFKENATFSFSWEDTGLGTNIPESSELNISMDIDFSKSYATGLFTISFNTSQFITTGPHTMTLYVSWTGEPFYANRSSLISITVLNRQTTLDYPTPDPTFYSDNVTFSIIWTDVTNGASDGILGATIVVSDVNGVIPSNDYDVRPFAGGLYEIEFNTSRFTATGLWEITIQVSSSATGIADKSTSRNLDVRGRRTILSYEAIGKVAYSDSIEFVLYFDDLFTTSIIGNGSGAVTLEILTAGTWEFTSTWNSIDEWYDIVITSYPSYPIGTPFDITFRISYSNIAPFYDSDDLVGSFELRERLSLLSLEVAPNPTPFLDDAIFLVQFLDVDSDSGISANYIWISYGITNLTFGSDYTYTPMGSGFFEISINSTVLGGIGINPISVQAYWTSGAPYHDNASAAVSIRVTTRDTLVDITVPPSQTPFLDNVTFSFEYTDLNSGVPITSILTNDVSLYNNGTLIDSADYTLTPFGSGFIFTVDSETLGPTLGRYNLTIIIDWNEVTSPYYVDAQVTTWATVTTRTLSFALDPLDETRFGALLNITFTLTDMSIGSTVDGADITFVSQTLSLAEGVDYNITSAGSGVYIIRVDSLALGGPGNFYFDLDIDWVAGSPFYRALNTIELTGVISDIETTLIPLSDQVTVLWKVAAPLSVDYQNLLWMNLTSGATVDWTWPGVGVGTLTETGFTGTYTGSIDTSVTGAGTYVITITATRNDYEVSRAYITLVVQVLPSSITPIDPVSGSISIPRGSSINVTIYLEDVNNILAIPNASVLLLTADFEGYVASFIYTLTEGVYNVIIPANGPTIKPQGPYTLLIQASFDNFAPTSYIFNIELLASVTEILLSGETSDDMSVTFSKITTLTVNLTKPDFGGELFFNASLIWQIEEKGWTGGFVSNGDGTFYAIINTTTLGFGIWPVRIQANIWDNSSAFTDSSTALTLTITRIQTDVIRPTNLDVAWGWTGNLTFVYNGTFGPIDGASVEYTGEVLVGVLYALQNGTYLVEVDTTLASPGLFTVTMVFQKENYQEAPVGIQFLVRPAETELFVESVSYTPTYEGVLEDLVNLQIPFGDVVTINFFYNDTDIGNDFVGGLAGAISTENSFLRGVSIDTFLNVTIFDLGNGLYRVVFDTTDPEIAAEVSSEPYRLYIEMSLANRTISDILFRITVIDIPTTLVVVDEHDIWNFTNGEFLTIRLQYMDTWHNTGIVGAHFSANASTGAPFTVSTEEGSSSGQYIITISASGIKLTPGSGTVTILLGDGVYTIGEDTLVVELVQNSTDILVTNSILYGIPIGLVFLILGIGYLRVWSVPKRLRQINSQIKSIRKGKIPKPVSDVKSRQELITDLFNDTFIEMEITREVAQIPQESIPVEVPELGELLIQLSILTNLDQDELDEFKADIAKMKMSEQAAFVKEVIMQEAIRAARREGKTVEEIVDEIAAEASKKLAGDKVEEGVVDEDGEIVEPEEPEVESVFLPPKDEVPEVESDVEPKEPAKPAESEDVSFTSDMLSPFEIDELRKELKEKGVPPSEIDTILKQAKELPRDLVEELIKSLDAERRRD